MADDIDKIKELTKIECIGPLTAKQLIQLGFDSIDVLISSNPAEIRTKFVEARKQKVVDACPTIETINKWHKSIKSGSYKYSKAKEKYTAILKRSFDYNLSVLLFKYVYRENKDNFNITDNIFIFDNELMKSYKDLYSDLGKIRIRNQKAKDWINENKDLLKQLQAIHEQKMKRELDEQKFNLFYGVDEKDRECSYCHITESKIKELAKSKKLKTKRIYSRGYGIEIDQIDAEKGYTDGNIVLCCYWCNNAKTDEFNIDEFRKIGEQINKIWQRREFGQGIKLSFLFGAGISIPSGLASTQDITDRVFSGKDVIRDTDGSYYIHNNLPIEPADLYRKHIDDNIEFLNILKNATSDYYRQYTNRKWNYEDLYYLVEELYQETSGDTDNPITKYFLNFLETLISKFFKERNSDIYHINDLYSFFGEVKNYMKCVVRGMLGLSEIKGLGFLSDIENDNIIEQCNIFTLNHDILLEEYFNRNKIQICDGFTEAINNVRYWQPNTYNYGWKFNLFKVHGSINWYRLRKEGSDWHDEEVGIVTDGNIHRSKNREGDCQFDCDTYPLILVGTFNKLVEYSSGIFMDLISLFNDNLNNTDNLIISGYSFGDKGINARITEWAYKSRSKRIVVINPDIEDLKKNARGSVRNKWDSWLAMDKLRVVEKGIQDTNWNEIKVNLMTEY